MLTWDKERSKLGDMPRQARLEPAGAGSEGEEDIMSGGGAEVGIHGGVGGAVSGDDDVLGEPCPSGKPV